MFALRKASIKFWKFSQLAGISMTLVCAYSVSVLNAVITHDTMGSTATKAKNTSEKYFKIVEIETPSFLQADYRLTMDTPEDYELISQIYSRLKIARDNIPDLQNVISFLNANPEIAAINQSIHQTSVPEEIIFKIREHFDMEKDKFFRIKSKYYGGSKSEN